MGIGKNTEDMPKVIDVLPSPAVVAGDGGVLTSEIIQLPKNMSMSVWYELTSPGTINASIIGEISVDGVTFTEQEGGLSVDTGVTDGVRHVKGISPAVGPYFRLSVLGLVGNNAGTSFEYMRIGLADKSAK